jgi:5-methylcytosine-specific restriction endonuclease McrBC regulatory subunit McrC
MLADVEPVYRDHRDIDRMVYTRRNVAFQPVHQLCRFLLSNSSVSLNPGQRVQFSCFAFNMNSVFESYVRSLMRSAFGSMVRTAPNSREFKIAGLEKTIRLDGLVNDEGRKCVIECKNKLVTSEEKPDFDEGELRNADVYQVVAYAMHNEIKAITGALFYPFVGSQSFPAKLVGTSGSFMGAAGLPLPLNVLLINMQVKPSEIVDWLKGRLEVFLPQQTNQ